MKQIITTSLTLIFILLTGGQAMAEDESRLCKDAFWKTKPTAADVRAEINRGELDKHYRTLSPLHIAARKGSPETIEVLAKHIDVNTASPFYGFTPLHGAVDAAPENVSKLLELGADVNLPSSTEIGISNQQSLTPFHFATMSSEIPNLKLMLDAGADIELKDVTTGSTALIGAAHGRRADRIEFLINAGANLHATDNKGRMALHQAAIEGVVEPVKVLLDAGADVQATDNDGKTPLHLAVQNIEKHSDPDLAEPVDILLDAGADPFATDKDGKTPFDYARTNKDWLKHLSTYKRLKAASGE